MKLMLTVLLTVLAGASGWILAQDGGSGPNGGTRRPLDLPSGGQGDDEEDEDAPESIQFYGSEYEGDAFFWCLDKSCSMGWSGGAPLATLKQEMTNAVNQLSRRAEFSIVAFNTNYTVWSEAPKRATVGAKSSAISFISNMMADGTTCLAAAAVKTVQISHLCSKRNKAVIIVGDGVPECPPPYTSEQGAQALSDINGANYEHVPIHTIFISASEQGIQLMQQIAAANNGTFTLVN
ncbi:MAG: VWA domain-containing protein [Planctomycetes bacterium]|nr:VWA domain-containing protein [Planctomycetota bacterium]